VNWRPLAVGLCAAVLLGVAAATVTTPQPGALDLEPIDRNPGAGDPPPDSPEPPTSERPGISLPGIGVTLPLPTAEIPGWLQLVLLASGLLLAVVLVLRIVTGSASPAQLQEVDPDAATVQGAEDTVRDADAPGPRLVDAQANLENEVYRAWAEMTRLLDVDRPDSSTPREFADAAVDAGAQPEDISILTDAFVAVRYGALAVTPERRQSVAAALQRVRGSLRDHGEDSDTTDPSSGRPNDSVRRLDGSRGSEDREEGETE
jgi:hypothetical protein